MPHFVCVSNDEFANALGVALRAKIKFKFCYERGAILGKYTINKIKNCKLKIAFSMFFQNPDVIQNCNVLCFDCGPS